MNMEAVGRSPLWADEAVLRLMRNWADEKIQQQLDICSKRPINDKMVKLWLYPLIFSSKKVEDSNSLCVRKQISSETIFLDRQRKAKNNVFSKQKLGNTCQDMSIHLLNQRTYGSKTT